MHAMTRSLVTAVVVVALSGCFGPVEEAGAPGLQGRGLAPACEDFSPGCGDDPLAAAGCYVRCPTDSDCGAGFTCRVVSINPCANSLCDACGQQVALCLPATTCTQLSPGCGPPSERSTMLPAAGCYQTCSSAQDCAAGQRCVLRWVDPCAGAFCDACGGEQGVCE